MSQPQHRGRSLRAFFATLAGICLLAAGAAYGVTYYQQTELERDATRDARKLAVEVFQPLLIPDDVAAPIRGARYEALLAEVEARMLGGPIDGVRLWAADGTILFAEDPAMVGEREPDMRPAIHAAIAGTSESEVVGDRFRTMTSLRVGEPPTAVAVELGRSHVAIVEAARDPWYPWVRRGLVAAGVCAVLAIAAGILFALVGAAQRSAAKRRDAGETVPAWRSRKEPARAPNGDQPAYTIPGFQEEVEARRRAEDELEEVRRDRDALLQRVRRLEIELDEARGGPSDEERLRRAALARDELQTTGAEPKI
jgi:hypothetical protein